MDDGQDGFLSRWSRRKVRAREGVVPEAAQPEAPPAAAPANPHAGTPSTAMPATPLAARPATPPTATSAAPEAEAATAPTSPPPPTLEDVASLTSDSDYSRFVGRGVDPGVKNAALHKLFSNPHFNVMDGLDTYIDDYNRPDPLPAGMLEKMVQSEALGLFAKTPEHAARDADPQALTAPEGTATVAVSTDASTQDAASSDAVLPGASAPHATDDRGPPEALAPLHPPADPHRHLPEARTDEDPDLRLQPHDATGPEGPAGPDGHGAAGAGQDPGRQR